MVAIRAYASIDDYVIGEKFMIYTTLDSWKGTGTVQKPPLVYCHGASGDAYTSSLNVQESQLLKELAATYVVISGDWGGDMFGNDTAMANINAALAYIRTYWNATNTAPVMVGSSMGGCTVLNYALENAVTSVVACIPLTDLTGAWQNDLLSLRATINTAYGGTYDPAVHAAMNDPITFASSISSSVPICLMTSSADPYLPNYTAHRFVWNRPSTKWKDLGPIAHSGNGVGSQRAIIQSYISNPAAFAGDTVPTKPSFALVGESAGGANTAVSSTTVTLPTVTGGILANDVILIWVSYNKGASGTVNTSVAGYLEVYDAQTATTFPAGIALYGKVAAGGETSATIAAAAAAADTWVARVYRGSAGVPLSVTPSTSAGGTGSYSSNAVSVASAADLILTQLGGRGPASGIVSPVWGGGAVADYTTASGRIAYLYLAKQTGITGSVQHTVSTTNGQGIPSTDVGSVVLRAA